MARTNLEKITKNTKIWTPRLNVDLPINGLDIMYFQDWVNWNGSKGCSQNHNAYDFAAYLTTNGHCILGLPENVPIRAIADGVVTKISQGITGVEGPYACFMTIEHGAPDSGLFTVYRHIAPLVRDGQKVRKGEVVATLHKDDGNTEGRLVHLHFEMRHAECVNNRIANPETVFRKISAYTAEPQGSTSFRILEIEKGIGCYFANFKRLLIDNNELSHRSPSSLRSKLRGIY